MKTGRTRHIDLADLTAWFHAARPGASMIYATGNVANDRVKIGDPISMLHIVAITAMEMHDAGLVELFQRRAHTGGFHYFITKRRVAVPVLAASNGTVVNA